MMKRLVPVVMLLTVAAVSGGCAKLKAWKHRDEPCTTMMPVQDCAPCGQPMGIPAGAYYGGEMIAPPQGILPGPVPPNLPN